ncbi:MAG: PadR family transcriptional regulator [Saprospiraceae bacterium]|jgi:PadR family transcriptional regulator PadR|nr:PadR family transcriptional regulator [Saprospiraceae bacterium]MBK6480127.1 PadR family transcriptional regulator [Saprospiraceae bacterium]MBK6815017.1 PadR family transcriptional regulator [Saprospiraceae bacterium]MBK7372063.1 PadR family transcriptional regulator [Saprospiraceae bacterium]MBK7435482.1 PadR family transcriptional regulator [Saprospiraceae bacterium]
MDGNTLNIANSKAQLRKGVLELCILAIIHEQPIYPSDIIKRLKESQLIVVEGTLYPLLNRLKDAGYLEYNWQESRSGPPRKYYQITEHGKQLYLELHDSWNDLVHSVNQTTNNK